MNIITLGTMLAALAITTPNETTKPDKTDAIILIDGSPMAASVTYEANVLEVYGPIPSYFTSDENAITLINKAKASSQAIIQIELLEAISVVDTSQWSEFALEEVSMLRELVITHEKKIESTGFVIVGHQASRPFQSRIKNLLTGFGVDQSLIDTTELKKTDNSQEIMVGLYKIST